MAGNPLAPGGKGAGAPLDPLGVKSERSERHLVFVLLLVQASNALLASGIQSVFFGLQLTSIAGVLGLLVLAIGVLRGWRRTRRVTYLVEGVMLLGTLPRLLQAVQAQAWPEGIWLLTNIGLPLAVLASPRLPAALPARLPLALLLVSAGVHLGLVQQHWLSQRGLGASFVLDAVLLAGAALTLQRGRRWRLAAGGLLVGNLVAYLIAVGPGQEAVESVGLQTKLVELIALGLLLAPRAAVGLFLCTLLTGAVTWASLARDGKVGQHTHTPTATTAPSYDQRVAANDLVSATRAGIAIYADPAVAHAAGYQPNGPLTADTVHYVNKAYEQDADVLDPSHPEGLVYASSVDGPWLVGALFTMPKLGQDGPTPGGTITHWHTHDNVCIALPMVALAGLSTPIGICPPGAIGVTTPAMMHIWTVDNPGGPFANQLDPAFTARLARKR
jgi:hypothetical protein